jgi:RNA polymerase sigma factor (sigma-70 family)
MKKSPHTPLFTTLDEAPGYIFITDNKAKILYTNQSISERTGYSPAETIGKNPGDLWGGNMPNDFYQKLWESLTKKHKPFSDKAENKRKNGEIYTENIHILPIFEQEQAKYFFAFQPIVHKQSDTINFTEKFQKSAEIAQKNPNLFFQFITENIAGKNISTEKFERSTPDILFEQFIAPTEQKFLLRSRDTQLIHKAQENSEKFGEIYLMYRENITQYFLKRLGYNYPASEDLTQETFIRAFSHLSNFSPSNASYQTYLLRIAHNLLVNHFRKTVFSPLNSEIMEQIPAAISTRDIVDEQRLEKSLQSLKSQEREALNLLYKDQYSIREIALKYAKSENAIKLMISRARRKLQKMLR